MINGDVMHAMIVDDDGTGRMIRDPVSYFGRGKQPVDQQPNLDTGAPIVTWGGNPPSPDGDRTTLPIAERTEPPGTGVGKVIDSTTIPDGDQSAAAAAVQFGPSKDVIDSINATAANAGANKFLGPQYSYGPGTTTTTSGGGSPILIFAAIAIVGVLLFLHFRKKHAEHS